METLLHGIMLQEGRTVGDVGRGIGEALNGADNTDSRRENAVTNNHGRSQQHNRQQQAPRHPAVP